MVVTYCLRYDLDAAFQYVYSTLCGFVCEYVTIYIYLYSRKRFLLPVTYFSTNVVYPFTLRVTDIIIKLTQNIDKPHNTFKI